MMFSNDFGKIYTWSKKNIFEKLQNKCMFVKNKKKYI